LAATELDQVKCLAEVDRSQMASYECVPVSGQRISKM